MKICFLRELTQKLSDIFQVKPKNNERSILYAHDKFNTVWLADGFETIQFCSDLLANQRGLSNLKYL